MCTSQSLTAGRIHMDGGGWGDVEVGVQICLSTFLLTSAELSLQRARCRDMLSQKPTRITLRMNNFQEYERIKEEKDKSEGKASNQSYLFKTPGPLERSTHAKSTPVRSSTPEHQ